MNENPISEKKENPFDKHLFAYGHAQIPVLFLKFQF